MRKASVLNPISSGDGQPYSMYYSVKDSQYLKKGIRLKTLLALVMATIG